MAGILRWKDLQNVNTTEKEINQLFGLLAVATDLNRIVGYKYTGKELNSAFETVADYNAHKSSELTKAHPLEPNTLNGLVLADETVPLGKIKDNSNILLKKDIESFDREVDQIEVKVSDLEDQVKIVYDLAMGINSSELPAIIQNLIKHIDIESDAHDASAISFGNYYPIETNILAGSAYTKVSKENARFFKEADFVRISDDVSSPFITSVSEINYDTGQIRFQEAVPENYELKNNPIIFVETQKNIQAAITRSLRNTTDTLYGRLSIIQSRNDDALIVQNNGTGYSARFNNFTSKTSDSFSVELGSDNATTNFEIRNDSKRVAFSVNDIGVTKLNDIIFEDRATKKTGYFTKQGLSEDRLWKLPNRSGYVPVGDLTFQELLKVTLDKYSKSISIAPAFLQNYDGEFVHAWTTMEKPSAFPGGTVSLEVRLGADGITNQLTGQWVTVVPFLTDNDNIGFFYGPLKPTKQEAIEAYECFVPSAYMKLAKLVMTGDGQGNIDATSIEVISDQRPIFTMGVSSAFYDEKVYYNDGLISGSTISLPRNSRAGGIRQTYKIGKGQLEVYLDGVYQEVIRDYVETIGQPEGKIRILKDIKPKSEIRFRITYTAAAASGGIQAATLQSAYQASPFLMLTDLYGKIEIDSMELEELIQIKRSIRVDNGILGAKYYELTKQSSEPGDLTKTKLWSNTAKELLFGKFNINKEIEAAQTKTIKKFFNNTGGPIPARFAVALHPVLPDHIVLADTSTEGWFSKVIGITETLIESDNWGSVVLNGTMDGFDGFSHGETLVVNPKMPGELITKTQFMPDPIAAYVEVGIINGTGLIVMINDSKKDKNYTRTFKAGENFAKNIPVLVRLGKPSNNEVKKHVYKATKTLANATQNFWVYGIVCPKVDILAGQWIDVYLPGKEIKIVATVPFGFEDNEIGLPLYLGNDGTFDVHQQIAYGTADVIAKVGFVEDNRSISLHDIQIMSTVP